MTSNMQPFNPFDFTPRSLASAVRRHQHVETAPGSTVQLPREIDADEARIQEEQRRSGIQLMI